MGPPERRYAAPVEGSIRTCRRPTTGISPVLAPISDKSGDPEGVDDDEQIRDWVRATVGSMFHPTGTCAMGGAAGAVCDPELRVRGVEGLRVVDASVMPTVPRGNTNAPVIALAERAADLIRGEVPVGTQTELSQIET